MTTWELQKKIHEAVKENLHIGMTENELADVISAVAPQWQGDLISGERSADIEGCPTDRKIAYGDVVLLDLQVCTDGQWSDLTRVYFMGEASDAKRAAYEQVVKAISVGETLLRPDTKANDIWHTVRNAIGTEFAFTHHAGHRIGTEEIVTEPRFVPESEDILKEGMVVTLEPAVYYPDAFGIRLENNYLITESGFKRLCSLPININEYIVEG